MYPIVLERSREEFTGGEKREERGKNIEKDTTMGKIRDLRQNNMEEYKYPNEIIKKPPLLPEAWEGNVFIPPQT